MIFRIMRLLLPWVALVLSCTVDAKDGDDVRQYGSWKVSCSEEQVDGCYMSLLGKNPKNGEALYRVGVRYETFNDRVRPLLKVLVPLGVSLMQAPVLTVSIDRPEGPKSFVLDYSRCVNVGCLSVKVLSAELRDHLRNGHTGTLMFVDGLGKIHKYSFSLSGSSRALALVQGSGLQ